LTSIIEGVAVIVDTWQLQLILLGSGLDDYHVTIDIVKFIDGESHQYRIPDEG
jgi:hypothetical protein